MLTVNKFVMSKATCTSKVNVNKIQEKTKKIMIGLAVL